MNRKALGYIVPMANGAQFMREKTKSLSVKKGHEVRLIARQLGRKMALDGRIPSSDLVLHMALWEIGQLIATRSPVIVQK